MESMPWGEPHTRFSASHSRSLACSSAALLVPRSKALDSRNTYEPPAPASQVNAWWKGGKNKKLVYDNE